MSNLGKGNFKSNFNKFSDSKKITIKGVIEGVYENMLKIKVPLSDGSSYYKWLDEDDAQNLKLEDKTNGS